MTTGPDDDPWQAFVATPAPRSRSSRDLVDAMADRAALPAAVAIAVLLLGAPAGLLWARLSPRVTVSFSAQGPELVHPESSEFFMTEASFLIVMTVAGLLTGLATWIVARRRGPGVPLGIAVGSVLAAAVARVVGGRVVVDERLARVCREASCEIYDGTLNVRSPGLVLMWAVAALAAFIALTALLDKDDEERVDAGGSPTPGDLSVWAPPRG